MSNTIRTGGPAFAPTRWRNDSDSNAQAPDGTIVPPHGSVTLEAATLRDYFAAHALQGFIASFAGMDTAPSPAAAAKHALGYADAMIAMRDGRQSAEHHLNELGTVLRDLLQECALDEAHSTLSPEQFKAIVQRAESALVKVFA